MPGVELDHRARVVAEMPQQPPETFRPAHVPVGDDEDSRADSGPRGRLRELLEARQRMPAARAGRRSKITIDVEERGAGDVAVQVSTTAGTGVGDVPAAVDEPVKHT